jgi:hypothetical protein
MKKFLLLLFGISLFVGCQKKTPDTPIVTQSVTFGVQQVNTSVLKSDIGTWNCTNTVPDRAWIQIDGLSYYAQLTIVNGKLYSQSVKLTPGTHIVNNFVLYKETDGIEGITGSDIVVFGIPDAGSAYAIYVDKAVDFPIEVSSFEKTEVPVQVLCFNESKYSEFGYDWFLIDRTIVREQCFFGDICTDEYMQYAGSDYENQSTGLQKDMPAIIKIMAYKQQSDGSWALLANGGTFTNDNAEAGWGIGVPVCVQYPDNLSTEDNFKFELYILVKKGNGFSFVLFHTWTFKDAEMIPAGSDGVVDFELGDCNAGSADLHLPPYHNLPATAYLKVENATHGTKQTQEGLPGYFDIILSNIDSGYELTNGMFPGNSLSRKGSVTFNSKHEVNIISSINTELMGKHTKDLPWDKANWLINHLGDYPGHTWSDIQQALWMLEDPHYKGDGHGGNFDPDPITAVGLQMVTDANLYGGGYVPGPHDLVALVFESVHGNAVYSLFIRYSPS